MLRDVRYVVYRATSLFAVMESSRNFDNRSSRDEEEAIDASATGPDHQQNPCDKSIPPSPRLQPDEQTEVVGLPQNINSTKHLEIEKVIVLSFRSLQLSRISQLQDDLLRLTMRDAAGNAPPDHTEKVDKALENYGNAASLFSMRGLTLPQPKHSVTMRRCLSMHCRKYQGVQHLWDLFFRWRHQSLLQAH